MIRFYADVAGVEVIDRAFNRIDERMNDLRFLWPPVIKEFYVIEEGQFASEGAKGASGKWAAVSPAYKKWKEIHYPGQPILKLTNALYESLTDPEAPDAVFRAELLELVLGTKVPYARAHQFGTAKIPARPSISLTANDKRIFQKAIQSGLVQLTRSLGFQVNEKAA